MEVGAVKQAFNNELILLKKNLNQAKIQVIHKLTRKAKQLTEKKAPDPLKEKFKRKAESAVKEVLIIKKIKARDIGKFSITHKGKLQDYLNKPQVDNDKACARLLLHKALQEKYKLIRNRFSNIPIKDLFMSRQERLKLKKEEIKKKKDKKKEKEKKKGKVVNAEGDWDVEDIGNDDQEIGKSNDQLHNDSNDDNQMNEDSNDSDKDDEEEELPDSDKSVLGSDPESIEERIEELKEIADNDIDDQVGNSDGPDAEMDADNSSEEEKKPKKGSFVKLPPALVNKSKPSKETKKQVEIIKSKPAKQKQKDTNKNKNLNDKIIKKKFKRDNDEGPNFEKKIVDPFFITASGENYMSVAEPRPPDEVKDEHKQGNRKLRRAVMFGHVPKSKLRKDFPKEDSRDFNRQNNSNNRFNDREKPNNFQRNNSKFNSKPVENKRIRFDGKNERNIAEEKPEKLHPSWEAKKKQSGILPFKGKKIVFDDS